MNSTELSTYGAASSTGCTFLPDSGHGDLEDLLDAVWRNRFTTFFALQGEAMSLCAEDCDSSGFLAAACDILGLDASERRALISHPVFRAWMALTLREMNARLIGLTEDPRPLRNRLEQFSGMLGRVREAISNPFRPAFHGLDIDPLIAAVLPPSYTVPDDPAERNARSRIGHPLGFFKDVAQIALDRTQATWPQVHEQFNRLVYDICYLPDGDFRSCSASRYTGVILLSSRDSSVLDLEESLVHEAGHQLLYHIVEVHEVTDANTDGQYRLPWSSQVRDLYGYFHAFFIYVLLAKYHERAMNRPGPDADLASARLRDILRGLVKAVHDFQDNPHLTDHGQAMMATLSEDVFELQERHRPLLAA